MDAQIVVGQSRARRDFTTTQLKLIRRGIARSCTEAEFDEFIAVASQCGLDPLRRQIAPLVLSPDDAARRRFIPWATIDGLRVMAARQGDYRPMEAAPRIECDQERIDSDRNPLGVRRAEVCAWKRDGDVWHPVVGEAWWDEYAPVREEWIADGSGRRQATGKLALDPNWRRMGRVMIAKCAESQALRRGWPDVFSGLYAEEELHALKLGEQSASQRLEGLEQAALQARRKTRTLWFVFEPGGAFEPLTVDQAHIRLQSAYETAQTKNDIENFQERNRASLQTLWEWAPADALALKQLAEASASRLSSADPNVGAADRQGVGAREEGGTP